MINRAGICRTILILVLLLPFCVEAEEGSTGFITSRMEDRVIKSFDFDERKLGNFEAMPMNWRRIRDIGYHRFLDARLDEEVGRTAPPSFRFGDSEIGLGGANIGSHYLAKDVSVRPNCRYKIVGWIKPSGLVHARAYITAYYLDHGFQMIEASERRSRHVRGGGTDEEWQSVSVQLPGGFENARWIGLACRVEQASESVSDAAGLRPIDYRDVQATAWFDDISVLRLPDVSIRMGSAGNVFPPDEPVECSLLIADLDGSGLDAELEILGADDSLVQTYSVETSDPNAASVPLRIEGLSPGKYTARLSVHVEGSEVVQVGRSFIVLGRGIAPARQDRRGIGVIVDPSEGFDRDAIRNLVRRLGPSTIKYPLWRSGMDDEDIVVGDPSVDSMLHILQTEGITLVGTLDAPPYSLAEQYGTRNNTLLDVLSSSPDRWRPYLALVLTRYGLRVQAWQLGSDHGFGPMERDRLAVAAANVRAEIASLVSSPRLIMPRSVQQYVPEDGAGGASEPDTVSLIVPQHISALRLADYFSTIDTADDVHRWATLIPLDDAKYDRMTRLISLAQRIVVARCSGIDEVFVPQPWKLGSIDGEIVSQPMEEYIILRALIHSIGGLEPLTSMWLGHGIHAWLFGDESSETGVIVAWTEGDPIQPRMVTLDLSAGAKQIDMWENTTEIPHVDDGLRIELDSMPIVISPVSLYRARLLAGFQLDDPRLRVALRGNRRKVRLANPGTEDLRGVLSLQPPVGWRIRPQKIPFDLKGGEVGSFDINIRLPNNQAMQDCQLVGQLQIEGAGNEAIRLVAPVHVESPGLDVSLLTRRDGDQLVATHRVTNLTDRAVNLHVFLIAPDRSRTGGIIRDLGAGETAVREYRIDVSANMKGRYLRVGVDQIEGPLHDNRLIRLE